MYCEGLNTGNHDSTQISSAPDEVEALPLQFVEFGIKLTKWRDDVPFLPSRGERTKVQTILLHDLT